MLWKANIDIQFVAESSLALAHLLVGMSLRLKKVACKRYGKRLVRTRAYIVDSGALVYEVYALESVVYMRLAIYCLGTISLKNLQLFSGWMCPCLKEGALG